MESTVVDRVVISGELEVDEPTEVLREVARFIAAEESRRPVDATFDYVFHEGRWVASLYFVPQ